MRHSLQKYFPKISMGGGGGAAPVLDPPLKIDLKRRKIKNVIRRFISAEIDRVSICHKKKKLRYDET